MSLPLALLAAVLITAVIGGFIELVLIRIIEDLQTKVKSTRDVDDDYDHRYFHSSA